MIEALSDNVIIKPIEEPTQTPGGIVLPDRAKKDPKFGVIEYVGPDVKHLKIGDKVVVPNWSDNEIEIDGVKYLIVIEKNINVRIS